MKLIAGLGNPGEQYARTRHNVGFMVIDELATRLNTTWRSESKFKAEIAQVDAHDQKLVLIKPQTFMNASGEAIQAVANFYKIDASDIWVIFDDVDTPFGRLRIRQGGSGSGHQGINSAIQHLGPHFWRIKVGISLNDRTREPSEIYVLKPFNNDERPQLPGVITGAADITLRQLEQPAPEINTFTLS